MRSLSLFLLLTACVVSPVAAEPAADVAADDQEVRPALLVHLSANLPEQDSLPDLALSITEQLLEISHLHSFDLSTRMSDDKLAVRVAARFSFENLSEVSDWRASEPVQALLESLSTGGDEPPRLEVAGSLAGM
jgi:hypothetical protein